MVGFGEEGEAGADEEGVMEERKMGHSIIARERVLMRTGR
jgi:hypothetical protein